MWTRRIFLALGSAALSLVGIELTVLFLGLAPQVAVVERGRFRLSENAALGYEPVPSPEYLGDDLRFYDFREASNSLGYRDLERPREKPPGTRRIAVLGDSIAAGLRVELYGDTFPAILQDELLAAGLAVEVLNFGVSGYDTRQEVETLKERALAFHPDLVLLSYCLNDDGSQTSPILEALLAEQERQHGAQPAAEPGFLLHSALYRALAFGLFAASSASNGAPMPDGNQNEDAFAELQRLSETHGFQVVVAVFPRFHKIFRYRWQHEHDRVRDLSRRHGLRHLDLLDAYRACWPGKPTLLSEDTWHPTAYGHRCAAEAMARFILGEVWPAAQMGIARPGWPSGV